MHGKTQNSRLCIFARNQNIVFQMSIIFSGKIETDRDRGTSFQGIFSQGLATLPKYISLWWCFMTSLANFLQSKKRLSFTANSTKVVNLFFSLCSILQSTTRKRVCFFKYNVHQSRKNERRGKSFVWVWTYLRCILLTKTIYFFQNCMMKHKTNCYSKLWDTKKRLQYLRSFDH